MSGSSVDGAQPATTSDNHRNRDQHFTPYRCGNQMDISPAHTSDINGGTSREAGRWAEAFQKNVLARHEAAVVAEPQPSRRPTPHSATTTKTTTITTTTVHGSNGESRPPSTLASPTPHAGSAAPPVAAGAIPRVTTSRTVAAVAVHPPLSRNSKRTAAVAAAAGIAAGAPAARSASLPSTSSGGSHSATTTTTSVGQAEADGRSPRVLPPPPELRHAAYTSASATATPIRPVASQPYTTPHARLSGTSGHNSGHKAKPLSQRQLQSQRTSGGNSPVNSAATPHIPCAYASSPFFQRAKDTAATTTTTTAYEDGVDRPAAAAAVTIEGTPHLTMREAAGEEAEDSALLQEVTPITRGGDSWRHDSQLLSQSRDTTEVAGAAAAAVTTGAAGGLVGGNYFSGYDGSRRGEDTYADPSATLLPTGASRLHPPPPPLPVTVPMAAASTTLQTYHNSPISAVGSARGVASVDAAAAHAWNVDGPSSAIAAASSFHPQTSPYQPAMHYTNGYAVGGSDASYSKPPCMAFTSPYTPGDVTRLSASPGGLSGSHNATMNTTAYGISGMTSGLMLPASAMLAGHMDGAAVAAAAAATYLPPPPSSTSSAHLYSGAGGVPPYFHGGLPMSTASNGGAPSPDFRPPPPSLLHHRHSQSPSPTQPSYSAAAGRVTVPVPSVSGTTAATTVAITSGLSGVALEKQLLHASKAELVQILLELGSCNPEASRFIDAKAFFFAFRHEHRHGPMPAPAEATAAADTDGSGNDNKENHAEEDPRPPRPTQQKEAEMRKSKDTAESTTASVTTVRPSESATSSNHSIARCIFPAEAADDDDGTDGEGDDNTTTTVTPPPPAATPAAAETTAAVAPPRSGVAERRVRPEERVFCAEVHPCLRWYGACRNATSCAYAGLPRNLCLNWVRGACVARTECSGVHRLPDPCPPELRRIYLLNHGLSRSEAAHAFHAPPVPSSTSPAARASPPPQRRDGPATSELPSPPSRGEVREGSNAGEAVGSVGGGSALHTPRDQSICKDTFFGGDSTPHRRHSHREGEARGRSPWSAMDDVDEEAWEGDLGATGPYLRELYMNGALSPIGSSCSTVEDTTMSDVVNRCLGHDFESAVTPTSQTATDAVPADVAAETKGRRSPVALPVCAVKEPLRVVPLRSVATAVNEAETEDNADFSAPAAGTQTRMQSPSYV